MITLVGLLLGFNVVSTAFMPSLCGMLVNNEQKSIVTKMLYLRILPRLFILLMKSVESLLSNESALLLLNKGLAGPKN